MRIYPLPIEPADKLLAALRDGTYDVAIGSRAVDRSLIEVRQSAFRERAGILFNQIVRRITGLPSSGIRNAVSRHSDGRKR